LLRRCLDYTTEENRPDPDQKHFVLGKEKDLLIDPVVDGEECQAGGKAQVVEHQPHKHQALSSTPAHTHKGGM
jgi:hypothetical protein